MLSGYAFASPHEELLRGSSSSQSSLIEVGWSARVYRKYPQDISGAALREKQAEALRRV